MKITSLKQILVNHIKSETFEANDGSLDSLQDLAEIEVFSKLHEGDNIGDTDVVPVSSYSLYVLLITNDGFEEIVRKRVDSSLDGGKHPEYIRNLIRKEVREYPGFSELPDRTLNEAIDDKISEYLESKQEERNNDVQ